jgi:Type I restriction modification DNA specificity domain.
MARIIWQENFGNNEPNGVLGNISTISSGKRPQIKEAEPYSEVNIPILGASSIMGYTNSILYDKKLLVTGRVGTHGIIQRYNRPCWPSDNTLVLNSNFYEFVYQILKSIDFSSMNRGSTQPLITQTDLKKVSIYVPTKTELIEFEDIVGVLMNQYDINIIENENLVQLRDALLPKLISGEISVPQAAK